MTKHTMKTLLMITALFTVSAPQILYGQEQPPSGSPTQPTSVSASELQALAAPIALYPDPLVAQILTASTYPDQVAAANDWYKQNAATAGGNLMVAVDAQSWDPSVKALTQFPAVLNNMATNLSWTSSLGEAYHNQTADLMAAIQNLRAQAKAAGNLQSGSQITVVQQSPSVIVIQPANPQVVYVPVYNPAVVYGTAYVVPAYTYVPPPAGAVVAAGVIGFAAGVAIASSHSACCAWGYSSWNCGWHGGSTVVVYHGGAYPPNPAWHGGYYNGGYHDSYGYNKGYNTYNSATNTYTHDSYNSQTHSVNQSNYNPSTKTYSQNGYNSSTGVSKNSSTTYDASTHTATTSTTYNDPNRPGSSSYTKDTNTTYNPSSHSTTTTNSYSDPARAGSSGANSWAQSEGASHSTAYSGMSGHSGGYGNSGGWSSNAESGRGWGSMRSSGFSGGRFGGGAQSAGGRWGGGGFRR
jgi:uncharacterized membrane protein YgcG